MKEFLKQLKEIWFLLVFFAAMVMFYANTNSRLTDVEAAQQKQETINQQIIDLNTKVEVISANVDFIKERVK